MVYWIVDGKELGEEEYAQLEKRRKAEREAERIARWQAEEQAREQAAELIRQLGRAYTAYKEFTARHPQLSLRVSEGEAGDHLLYQELRQNLERADAAPRCTHIKTDGIPCGSPRMRTGLLCYAHQRMQECRSRKLPGLSMEDPNAIQLGLMEVSRALLDGEINEKTAGLLLYALQSAAGNVARVSFHQAPDKMVVDQPAPPAAAALPSRALDPDPSLYEALDDDLKLKLQEISDEFDRRLREKAGRKDTAGATAADTTDAKEEADWQANPKPSAAAEAGERRAGPLAETLETGFGGEVDKAG